MSCDLNTHSLVCFSSQMSRLVALDEEPIGLGPLHKCSCRMQKHWDIYCHLQEKHTVKMLQIIPTSCSLAKFLFLVTFLNLTFTYGVIPLLGEAEWVEEEEEEEEE